MSSPDLDPMVPLDPLAAELADLVATERAAGAAPAPGKDAVASRLEASLFGGGGGGGGGRGGGPAPESPAILGTTPHLAARLVPLATAFALGAATSAAIFLVRPPETRVEVRERIVEVRVPTPIESGAPLADVRPPAPSGSATPSAAPPVPSSSTAPAAISLPSSDSLGAERAILDTARTAVGRKDGSAALESIRKHETRFPNGKLTEEREAIAVQALSQLGRRDEASERGRRFATRWPSSVLLPVVKAALEER